MLRLALLLFAQAMFRGNAAHTGIYPPGPQKAPSVKWTFKAAGPIVTSAAIDGGVVYFGALDGHLHAVAQDTGAEKWNFKSVRGIASSPAVANHTVYFVSSAGSLAAIDATSGKPKWVFPTEYERRFEAKNLHGYEPAAQIIPDAYDLFTSAPTVANGKVYFGSGDGCVYAVDAASGVLQWKFATQDVVHASPAVVGRTVYVGSWDGRFYALDAETGLQKWVFQGGEDETIHNQVGFQASATVVDGTVYVGSRDAHVYALDAATGKKRWDYPTSKSWVNTSPAVRDGIVYAGTSDSSKLLALDVKNGRLRMSFDAKSYVFSSPALAGGLLYVGDHNGRLYALDAKTFAPVWEFRTEASKKDPLHAFTPEGRVNQDAFAPLFNDFEDMYLDLHRFITVGAIVASPVVDKGVIYIGSMDGNLYALQ
jgi:outer membrane protein assembly factor BamB